MTHIAGGAGWGHLVCVIMTHCVRKSICDSSVISLVIKGSGTISESRVQFDDSRRHRSLRWVLQTIMLLHVPKKLLHVSRNKRNCSIPHFIFDQFKNLLVFQPQTPNYINLKVKSNFIESFWNTKKDCPDFQTFV